MLALACLGIIKVKWDEIEILFFLESLCIILLYFRTIIRWLRGTRSFRGIIIWIYFIVFLGLIAILPPTCQSLPCLLFRTITFICGTYCVCDCWQIWILRAARALIRTRTWRIILVINLLLKTFLFRFVRKNTVDICWMQLISLFIFNTYDSWDCKIYSLWLV